MKLFKRWSSAGVILAVTTLTTTLLAGCGGDDSYPTAGLRIVHAGSDAPLLNVRANGAALAMAQGLAFAKATSTLAVRPATYSIAIDGVLVDGSVSEQLAAPSLLLNAGNITTLVAMGEIAAGTFELKEIVTPRVNITADSTRIQIVHASVNTPSDIDVYVTAPGAALTAADATVAWGQVSAPWVLAADEYQIRVTPTGTPGTVIFDSGPISLAGGADLMLLAVDNYGPSSPMKLLASTGAAAQDFIISDQNVTAEVRLVHAASGAGPIDVFASSVALPLLDTLVAGNIISRGEDDAEDLAEASDYIFKVNKAGTVDELLTESAISLAADHYYTAVIAGDVPAAGNNNLVFLLNEDDRRSVATEARLRFIHAASTEEELALFITKAGERGLVPIEAGDVTPTVAETAFKYSDMVAVQQKLSPDDYDVRVAKRSVGNSFEVLINNENMSLVGGDVITLVIAQPDPDSGHSDFDFIQLND